MEPGRRSVWAVLAAVTIAAVVAFGWRWKNDPEHGWQRLLDGDTRGHQAYLRALFIDHDLGHADTNSVFVHATPDGTLLKYFPGTALCSVPAFLVAHGLAWLGADEPDGRSAIYAKCLSLNALIFLLIGLLALRALLLRCGITDALAAVLLFALGVGTNLLCFAALVPGMPHVYAFTAGALFLLGVKRFTDGDGRRWIWTAGAALGLLVLIRPVDAIMVCALPVLLGKQVVPVMRSLFALWRTWVPACLFFLAFVLLMPVLWHAQTGHWWEWSYRDEGFYWWHPRMWDVLFGFRQGFLVYAPFFLLIGVGIAGLFRTDRWRGAAALSFVLLITYVISAWWSWTYGDGLGNRAFIDHYAALLLIIALGLQRMPPMVQRGSIAFGACTVLLYNAQLYQYEHGLLHRFSMDGEKYAFTFLRFDPTLRDALGADVETPFYHPNGMRLVAEELCSMEKPESLWQGGKVEERHGPAHSGDHVCVLDSATEHGRVFALSGAVMANGERGHVVIDLMRYEAKAGDSFHARYGLSLSVPGEPSRYFTSGRLNPVPGQADNCWRSIHLELQVPYAAQPNEELRFYVWNPEHEHFLVDDMHVRVYVVEPY